MNETNRTQDAILSGLQEVYGPGYPLHRSGEGPRPRVFGVSALRRFVLADQLQTLLDLVGYPHVPHAVFDMDTSERDPQQGRRRSALGRLREELMELDSDPECSTGDRVDRDAWVSQLAALEDLARAGRLVIVGGGPVEEFGDLEELATLGDLAVPGGIGNYSGDGAFRVGMGVQESMAGTGIWSEEAPEGPDEAQALSLAIYRGWEVVTDSTAAHRVADEHNAAEHPASRRTRSTVGPAVRSVRSAELLAEGVERGLFDRQRASEILQTMESAEARLHGLSHGIAPSHGA